MHNYLLIHGLLTLILLDGQLFKRRIGNKKENLQKRNINKTLWMSLQWFIVPRYSPVKESSVRPERSEGMTSVHLVSSVSYSSGSRGQRMVLSTLKVM